MTTVAERWSAFWTGQSPADSLYREDAIYWPVERPPSGSGIGPSAAMSYRDDLAAVATDIDVDVYRVLTSGSEVVIEAIVSATEADGDKRRMGTGVCALIDLDDDGMISREQLHMQWRGRRIDDGDLRPVTPPQDGIDRGIEFWRDIAERQLGPWSSPDADPNAMIDGTYDPDDYHLDSMISKEKRRLVGREALREAEKELLGRLVHHETFISRIVHEGNAAAVWHPVLGRASLDAPLRTYSSLMVMTVNEAGRYISEHTYMPAPWC